MCLVSTALAAAGCKLANLYPQRYAGLATVAVGPVGKHTAASEAAGYQLRISVVVNEVAGGSHLAARGFPDSIHPLHVGLLGARVCGPI